MAEDNIEGGEGRSSDDEEALMREWAAMAGDDDGGGGGADSGEGDAAAAAEWEAMLGAEDTGGGGGDMGGGAAASARVLNQDEIDSLLGFDDGAGMGDGDRAGIQAILNSALVSYERLPMLEVVFDRLVRMMSTSMRNFTSDNVEVSLDNILSLRFGDYLNSIPLPAMLAVFKAEEWDNYGLLTVDSSLIYSIVDVLLGGRRGTAAMRIEGRPYTTIERNLVERMVHVVLVGSVGRLRPAVAGDLPLRPSGDQSALRRDFAARPTPPSSRNSASTWKIAAAASNCMLPYATLEPVRELLLQMFMGEKFGRDSIWETHLAEELWLTELEMEAVLDEQIMPLRDILRLRVGSKIMLNATPDSTIELRCGDVTMFGGKMGRKGNHIAIRVEEAVKKEKV